MSEPTVPPGPPPVAPPPPPPPPPGGAAGGASQNRGLMLVLSYLWLLAIVPLLVEKDDKEVQWHAKHGLVLLVAEIVAGIGLGILQVVISHLDFGCTGCILGWVFWLAILVLHILCIVKAVNGQRLIIPGVSQYADRF
jgi:uncharacterized membrane protein